MHAADAAERGRVGGSPVKVYNRSGEVRCLLEISGRTRRGVVVLPKGIWAHNTLNGATSNALCPDSLTDVAGGACFNDARVQVEPVDGNAR
jgi:anaerobic selenocysteine-containing dehydrogenase